MTLIKFKDFVTYVSNVEFQKYGDSHKVGFNPIKKFILFLQQKL